MNIFDFSWLIVIILLVGICVGLEAGRRIGVRKASHRAAGAADAGTGAIDASIFGLLGLLIAFTFYGAAARFDTRRDLIIHEVNAIGTAYLRLDLLPAEAQPDLRSLFRQYLDLRIRTYELAHDLPSAFKTHDEAVAAQGAIWNKAIPAVEGAAPSVMTLVISALNEMFDIATTRMASVNAHPPAIIFIVLVGLVLVSSVLAGRAMSQTSRRNWLHMAAFAATMAVTVYLILDLEYPRMGFISVADFDQLLRDLRQSMN